MENRGNGDEWWYMQYVYVYVYVAAVASKYAYIDILSTSTVHPHWISWQLFDLKYIICLVWFWVRLHKDFANVSKSLKVIFIPKTFKLTLF